MYINNHLHQKDGLSVVYLLRITLVRKVILDPAVPTLLQQNPRGVTTQSLGQKPRIASGRVIPCLLFCYGDNLLKKSSFCE